MAGNEVTKFIRNDSIQQRIESLLDKRAGQFTTSLITIANSNAKIAACKPETVLNAALTAASMDLPLNQNLGFAYIIPYGNEAQFQMGWKGYVQLAQRSGKYKTISSTPVYKGQLVSNDPLRGITFDWSKPNEGDPIGYVAFFELLNGFEKTLFMTADEMHAHATRYSKSFNSGPWKTDYDKMAMKTVLKLLINRFGPMSTEMQSAIENDQAVITDSGRKYVDGTSDLDNVGADEEQKQAIIEANIEKASKNAIAKKTKDDIDEDITTESIEQGIDQAIEEASEQEQGELIGEVAKNGSKNTRSRARNQRMDPA
jgi:recombination protein RecT